ncbi:MAG: DNA recombination protein RmuC, partial [Acidobacteriota bacterium]
MNTYVFLAIGIALGAGGVVILWLLERQRLVSDAARLVAERDGAVKALAEQRELLSATQVEVRETFAALSREALKDNRADFMHTADGLFAPVRETLNRVQTQLADVDRRREGTHEAVTTQLRSLAGAQEQLRVATEGLSSSLRSPNVRGKWGEIQLRRILELAGMLAQCDFTEKESSTTADGSRQTPDLIIRLPGGSTIVVDSKVPIDAYLSASSAATEPERQDHLKRHTRQVRDHIRALGAKEYWRQFSAAPEFVVMFLPLEPLLPAAFEQDATLLEQAASLRVIPATPMTLLALLKAVAYGWQQQAVAQNAEEIQLLGRELYERLTTMVDHLETVGINIKRAADGYDSFIGSLERKVLPSARRFKDLGVSTAKALETPDLLNLSVRRPRREAA